MLTYFPGHIIAVDHSMGKAILTNWVFFTKDDVAMCHGRLRHDVISQCAIGLALCDIISGEEYVPHPDQAQGPCFITRRHGCQ